MSISSRNYILTSLVLSLSLACIALSAQLFSYKREARSRDFTRTYYFKDSISASAMIRKDDVECVMAKVMKGTLENGIWVIVPPTPCYSCVSEQLLSCNTMCSEKSIHFHVIMPNSLSKDIRALLSHESTPSFYEYSRLLDMEDSPLVDFDTVIFAFVSGCEVYDFFASVKAVPEASKIFLEKYSNI